MGRLITEQFQTIKKTDNYEMPRMQQRYLRLPDRCVPSFYACFRRDLDNSGGKGRGLPFLTELSRNIKKIKNLTK